MSESAFGWRDRFVSIPVRIRTQHLLNTRHKNYRLIHLSRYVSFTIFLSSGSICKFRHIVVPFRAGTFTLTLVGKAEDSRVAEYIWRPMLQHMTWQDKECWIGMSLEGVDSGQFRGITLLEAGRPWEPSAAIYINLCRDSDLVLPEKYSIFSVECWRLVKSCYAHLFM